MESGERDGEIEWSRGEMESASGGRALGGQRRDPRYVGGAGTIAAVAIKEPVGGGI